MLTVEDFQKAIEATFDNESAAEACFLLAKKMALEYGAWVFNQEDSEYNGDDERSFNKWINSNK